MGRVVGPPIQAADAEWLKKQPVFFVGSAPLSSHSHVNVSPKSAKEFRVVDDRTVCWLDLSGSGAETAVHILENGRLTVMFVAFHGPPRIMRLYGKAYLVLRKDLSPGSQHHQRFEMLYKGEMPGEPACDSGMRCIVVLKVERISQSCGYSIPLMNYLGERTALKEFAAKKGDEGMIKYRSEKNSLSIDGLKSIGMLEQCRSPGTFVIKDGYYYSYYDHWSLKSEINLRLYMLITTGAHGYARDLLMIAVGFLCYWLFSFTFAPISQQEF